MNRDVHQQIRPRRSVARLNGRSAFTFAEVLAALAFMAIVIPVALEGLRIASQAGVVAERKAKAVALGEAWLNELIATDTWRESSRTGVFEDPAYRWQLINAPWSEDAMQMLRLEVRFLVQGREYQVELATLMEESSP